MTDDGTYIRLAAGAFDAGAKLWPALCALNEFDIGVDQLSLAALEQTLKDTTATAPAPARLFQYMSDLTDQMRSIRPFGRSGAELWASDWLFDALHPERTDKKQLEFWMQRKQRDHLVRLIDDRHLILGVRSADLDQHTNATKLLLEHGTNGVQTHEFAIPGKRQ